MLNSMYSGISGLNANQRKLDVIGNNIANSGTTAFKASSITFQDSMYQTIKSSSSASLNLGGTNPSQVGLGVSVQSINVNMGQGSLQPTGRPLDVAIDQTGYFVVGKGPESGKINLNNTTGSAAYKTVTSSDFETYFTRDGSFKLDDDGRLLTSNGYRIMGYQVSNGGLVSPSNTVGGSPDFVDADAVGTTSDQTKLVPLVIPETIKKAGVDVKIQSFSIEKDGLVKAVLSDGSTTVLGQVAMASFVNQNGLKQVGQNMYTPSSNSGDAVMRAGKGATGAADNTKAYGDMVQGALEMSNTDLAVQFTDMIVASRSFQACGKVISTGDEILQELVNLKR